MSGMEVEWWTTAKVWYAVCKMIRGAFVENPGQMRKCFSGEAG